MVGRKEEQRGNVIPGKVDEFSAKSKLVLYAQNGMSAELQVEVR